jgi:acetylornithine/succinyldiaminopimelate/putrescine aminotransferase
MLLRRATSQKSSKKTSVIMVATATGVAYFDEHAGQGLNSEGHGSHCVPKNLNQQYPPMHAISKASSKHVFVILCML